MSARKPPVPFSTRLAYGIGQIAEGVKNSTLEITLLFYYTQVLGLSGSLVGLAIFFALLIDAVTDPLVGMVSDNWRSKWGRRHPFMYASIVPLVLTFILLFMPPADLGDWGLFFWLLGFAVLSRFAMTLYFIPHMAQGAELTDDYVERTTIVAWRTIFGALGGVMTVTLIFMVFMNSSGEEQNLQLDPSIYPPMAIVLGLMIGVSVLISAVGTHRDIWRLKIADETAMSVSLGALRAQFMDVLSNRNFRLAVGGITLFFVMAGTHKALNLHMNTYFWELSGPQITILLYGAVVGGAFGIPFTPTLTQRFEKKDVVVWGALIVVLFQLTPPMLRLAGLFPDNGSTLMLSLLTFSTFVMGFVGMPTAVISHSLIADLCDEHEFLTGRRQEGGFFGGIAFSAKAAAGGGTLIGGVALDLIAFPSDAAVGAVGASQLTGLAIAVGPLAALFGVLSAIFYLKVTLTRARLQAIQQELASRRTQSVAEPGALPDALPVADSSIAP